MRVCKQERSGPADWRTTGWITPPIKWLLRLQCPTSASSLAHYRRGILALLSKMGFAHFSRKASTRISQIAILVDMSLLLPSILKGTESHERLVFIPSPPEGEGYGGIWPDLVWNSKLCWMREVSSIYSKYQHLLLFLLIKCVSSFI